MDLILRCRQVPRAGETIHGDEFTTAPGGKGANQAVACSRLGARTAMVGRVGDDEFGRILRAGLAAEAVDTRCVRTDPAAATGVALILLEPSGDNRIIVVGGANLRVAEQDAADASALLRSADAVLMQLEIPLDTVKAVAEAARELGVLSVLDAGAATPAAVEAGLPGLVDIVSPNETEAEVLTGIAVRDLEDARRAAVHLRDLGARHVVVKMGESGAFWSSAEGDQAFPAFPVSAVDSTAAGDAFTAALAVGLAGGLAMPEAIQRANAAGAIACLTLGAQPSMPTAAAVDDFLHRQR